MKSFEGFFTLIGQDLAGKIEFVCSDMWLTGAPLQIAAVAIAVYVLYLGVKAFCAQG